MSLSGVVNHALVKPLSLCSQDEFGSTLKRYNDRRASPHERAASGVLRELWGLSFQPYMTPEWAQRSSQVIMCPALSINAFSTPGEFYERADGL
jgi:hypothetical protein